MASFWNWFWIVAMALLALLLGAAELLDWIGRLEIVERKWPKVWKAINNRPMRIVLYLLLIIAIGRDISDRLKIPIPKLEVTFQAPSAPIIQVSQVSPSQQISHTKDQGAIVQTGNGNTANPGTVTGPIEIAPCGVFQNGGNNNTADTTCATGKTISPKTKAEIIRLLKSASKRKTVIISADQTSGSSSFPQDFNAILFQARWNNVTGVVHHVLGIGRDDGFQGAEIRGYWDERQSISCNIPSPEKNSDALCVLYQALDMAKVAHKEYLSSARPEDKIFVTFVNGFPD